MGRLSKRVFKEQLALFVDATLYKNKLKSNAALKS